MRIQNYLADLRFALKEYNIEIEYKHKRTTNEIEGVSFRYNNISFKGSEIDRKFSFRNLKKVFENNLKMQQKQLELNAKQKSDDKAKKEAESKPKSPSIRGVKLTSEQWQTLQEGGFIYLENMMQKDYNGKFSAYIFLNDEKDKIFSSSKNPTDFIKYGKYEMRIRDKILIEKGYMTKAKIKWYSIGTFAYPYLWKTNKSDTEYEESWEDPRVPKKEKAQRNTNKRQNIPILPKKNKGKKI